MQAGKQSIVKNVTIFKKIIYLEYSFRKKKKKNNVLQRKAGGNVCGCIPMV